MENRITLMLTIFIMTILSSCKKDKTQNDRILGNWKLVENYDGYANGGTFTWHAVANDDSHILTFSPNGQYKKIQNFNGSQECMGTYTLLNSVNLEINSNCNTVTQKVTISELTQTTLIIDEQVREGKIRDKYLKIN